MVTALILLFAQAGVQNLDRLAQTRDVAGLSRFLEPLNEDAQNPFQVIKTNGAYETGKFGWRALEGRAPVGEDTFVVFSTPLTSEDVGELVFLRSGSQLRYLPEGDSLGMRIVRHDFDVSFSPSQKRVDIVDRITLRKSGTARPYFLMRLSPSYRVESIESEGKPVAFQQVGGTLLVSNISANEGNMVLKYGATPDLRLYAGSIDEREATLTNDYWYPMIARQPAPYDIRVTAPSGWKVVVQGEPVEESTQGDKVVSRYRMDLPVVFYSLSAGPYRTDSREVGEKRYSVWSPNLSAGQMKDQLELVPPIVEFYTKRFGYWPFKRFGLLHSPAYGFGALEAYSYATYGGGLPTEDPHEAAHTLFGGALNNSYLKSFWNESFAAFCEGFYDREVPMGNTAERRLAFVRNPEVQQDYNVAPLDDAGAFIGDAAGTLGYGKGGYVLQMLEQLVGTEALTRAVARWIKERPSDRTVEWEDFRRVMVAEAPGSPVAAFFDDWISRPGYAAFSISDVKAEAGDLSFAVDFKGRSYTLPLEVLLVAADGRKEFKKAIVTGRNRRAEVRLKTSFRPKLVSVDPWRRLVRQIEDNERPTELEAVLPKLRTYIDPKHPSYLSGLQKPPKSRELPSQLDGIFLVAHPDSTAQMQALCEKAGWKIAGGQMEYGGEKFDLATHGALAIVDLGNGKRCAIGIGNVRMNPRIGHARMAIFDDLGRLLRAEVDPKTKGALTFTLPG
jgi:hypothetical protein